VRDRKVEDGEIVLKACASWLRGHAPQEEIEVEVPGYAGEIEITTHLALKVKVVLWYWQQHLLSLVENMGASMIFHNQVDQDKTHVAT